MTTVVQEFISHHFQWHLSNLSTMVCFPALIGIAMIYLVALVLRFLHNKQTFASQLYYKKSRLGVLLVKKCKMLGESFTPTFWAGNAHLQTLLPWILPQSEIEFSREYLQMADKGIIALDWAVVNDRVLDKSSPIMIIIPALTQHTPDMSSLCSSALVQKFRPVVFNRRGHGQTPLTTRRLQTFAEGGDLEETIVFINRMYPNADIFAVGLSSGSGLLISYLGELGANSGITAAVCISPCYDAEGYFKGKICQPYNWLLTWKLKELLRQHPSLRECINYEYAMQSETVKDFEERVFIKLNPQYYSNEEYCRLNNPMRNIANVSIPVLCVSALDDPICPKEIIPLSLFKTSSNFFLLATDKGGHCGFLENTWPASWANKLACDYLATVRNIEMPKASDDRHFSALEKMGPRSRSYTT
ncbi:protein ABHD15-like [Actinia tenebrosa]|uniref:Protein ABHD15-like n=1 Tax=Actinia tenebrosa TaxID=6105 RepID=A0A6P8JAV9_ACTTE|nr:protein ABHD15-like [Actinia tenebrosa]XP_031574856.1 protein ABHD15-like [Actinia tenebrosa]XP_031574857.1 protein ABHD15-like [Actinia tenebrosa]XP_031574858.1 protein ABHD15-like [Actinia tenebrosa]XP_031574859.1 protein ABHD15-like [Actinia tenebrosa]